MAETRVSEVLLRARSDVSGFVALRVEVAKTRGEIGYLAQTAKQQALIVGQAGESIRSTFSSQSSSRIAGITGESKSATAQMRQLKEEVTGVQQEIKKLGTTKLTDIVDPELKDVLGGTAGGGNPLLRKVGATIRQLPSQQIPGLGVGTDTIGSITRVFGELSPAALKTGVAIAGVSVALAILAANATKVKEAALSELDARQRALELLKAGNREEIQARIKALQDQRSNNQDAVADANTVFAQLREGIFKNFGSIGLAISDFNSTIGTGAGELSAAKEDVEKANKAFSETDVELVLLQQGLNGVSDAAAKSALALTQVNNAIDQDQARISAQIEAANLAANGTEQQVQDRLDSLSREKEVLQANLPIMQARVAVAVADSDAQKAAQTEVNNTQKRLGELDTSMLTLAGDTLAAAKANDAAAEAEKKRIDTISAVKKYNDDKAKIEEQAAQKEADLAEKLADKQIDIAQKAVDESAKVLAQLETKLADLTTDTQRDLDKDTRKANFDALQEQIKFQRNEVAETTKHLQDLERIRRQSRQQEFEQGLDRDFAGLAQTRRTTANQLAESNIQFNQDRQARLDAFQAKHDDDQAEFVFERQERIIKFQQAIADLRLQANREQAQIIANRNQQLRLAQAAYNNDLSQLRSKYIAELNARNSAITAELKLIQAGNAAKLAEEAKYLQQSKQLIQSIYGGSSGGGGAGRGRAFGGDVERGLSYYVNEPGSSSGRESFSNSRGTIGLPGFGLFSPLTSGTVNANRGGGMNVYLSIDARGRTNEQVADIVEARLTKYHIEMHGE